MASAYQDKLKAMRQSLEASKTELENLTGIIQKIDVLTAGDVYGDQAKDPDREVIQVHIFVEQTKDVFRCAFTLPLAALSWKNKSFKLGQYVEKYGALPEVGKKVSVTSGKNGFYEIEL